MNSAGIVLHDLFQGDDGGWLQDVALVNRLVAERLEREAEAIRAEGWKWIEIAPEFAYGHTYGLRQLRGEEIPLTAEEEAAHAALQAEYDRIEEIYAEAEELPEEADQRRAEIETALAAFGERPVRFDPAEVARAGTFVSIDGGGHLRVERGYVRPEDEAPVEPEPVADAEHDGQRAVAAQVDTDTDSVQAEPANAAEQDEDEGLKPIPDRLMTELTAHRTLALRHALGEQPDVAFLAALHALCIKIFYRYAVDSCLELDVKSVSFGAQAPGLNDTALAANFDRRHQAWIAALPKEPAELWDTLTAFDGDSRQALFTHCISLSINAMFELYNRRPRALAHADRLAEVLDLDMVAAGWTPTVENYLGRVTKARILGAVRESKGERAAQLIDHLKKGEMAEKAEVLLAGSGWLPEPLRTPGRAITSSSSAAQQDAISAADSGGVETAADGYETAMAETESATENEPVVAELHATAAE
jgi:ParB family transcriptional regulator, chromosome partitioning protein